MESPLLRWAVVVQARMGSRRLPGKVLKPLCGKPLLGHLLDRLERAFGSEKIILATTLKKEDDCLVAYAKGRGIRFYRGSESDLIDRYYRTMREFGLETVIRVTSDNPLTDTEELKQLLHLHQNRLADYSHNLNEFGSGLPKGAGVEIFSRKTLETIWKLAVSPHDREHVNDYIHARPGQFKIALHKAPPEKFSPEASLTVDTPGDFKKMEEIFETLQPNGSPVSLEEALSFLRREKG